MKKTILVAAILPVLSLGAGYGAALTLGEPAQSETAAKEQTPEEKTESLFEAAETLNGHDAPAEETADAGDHHGTDDADAAATKSGPDNGHVVKLGSMMVPVYKPRSVTYVVADFGVAMADAESAAHYRIAENAARLRNVILSSFHKAADDPKMKRAALDSDWLSEQITSELKGSFAAAQEVLFLSLYKKDVPRS